MQPVFVSLVLFAVRASVLVDGRPSLWDWEQRAQQQEQNSFYAATGADSSAAVGRFYLELSGPIKKGLQRYFGVLSGNTDTGNFASIYDLRRKRFLCINLKEQLYKSWHRDKDDCLFHYIRSDLMNNWGVFYSTSRGQSLKMTSAELHTAQREPPEPSSALLDLLVRRKRRSEEVNPSDPLGSQSLPSYFAKDHKDPPHGWPEQDQPGAVSRETIASCDDPLRVLQPNGPASPVKTNIAEWAEQH